MDKEPIAGRDYRIIRKPYFSTPFITIVTCLHDDCEYDTGKEFETGRAIQRYVWHWQDVHLPPATMAG